MKGSGRRGKRRFYEIGRQRRYRRTAFVGYPRFAPSSSCSAASAASASSCLVDRKSAAVAFFFPWNNDNVGISATIRRVRNTTASYLGLGSRWSHVFCSDSRKIECRRAEDDFVGRRKGDFGLGRFRHARYMWKSSFPQRFFKRHRRVANKPQRTLARCHRAWHQRMSYCSRQSDESALLR